MKRTLKQELKGHRLLITFSLISFLLLAIFSFLQDNEVKMLNLEIKWLIVCSVPIFIALFIGGYIKNFKGFGLELESNLKEPIPLTIVSKVDLKESPGLDKQSLEQLERLTDSEKRKINRLRFVYGKSNYYVPFAIERHYEVLRNLKFIEIINDGGEFLCVIPASILKPTDAHLVIDREKAEEFIHAIANRNFNHFSLDNVTDYVLITDNLIEAYRKIKKSTQSKRLFSKKEVLPILDEEKKMIGIIELQKLEAKIAEEVEQSIN